MSVTQSQCNTHSLGLGDQFEMVKEKYREANLLLGDIVKVHTVLFLLRCGVLQPQPGDSKQQDRGRPGPVHGAEQVDLGGREGAGRHSLLPQLRHRVPPGEILSQSI